MKKFLAIGAILTIGGLTLAGCPKPDAAQDATGTTAAPAAPSETTPSAAPAGIDAAKIKMVILADESLKGTNIDVKVTDTKVSLTGQVKNQDLKKKAEELGKTAAPDAKFINQITIAK